MAQSTSHLPLLAEDTIENNEATLTAIAHAVAAAKQGKLPSTEQGIALIQKLLKSNILQPSLGSRFAGKVGGGKLSPKGKELVENARGVLEALARVALEKNHDDKIQNFLWSVSKANVDIDGNLETPDVPLPTSREIDEASASLQQLFTLLITSNQLRSLVGEAVNIFRDLFADAAEQTASASIEATKKSKRAAKAARPSEQERKEGKTGLEGKELPSTKDLKKKALRSAEDAKDDAQKALTDKAYEIKEYFDESLPTDVKDAFIERVKAIVDEIQSDPEYSQAINTLISLVRKYASLTTDAVVEAAEASTAKVDANKSANVAVSQLREIVERFTGPLDDVFRTADKVIKDLKSDDRLSSLLEDAEQLLDRALNDPGWITSSRAQRRFESLWDRAQEIIESNASWKVDAEAFTKQVGISLEKAANDRALNQLGDQVEKFSDSAVSFGKTGFSLVEGGGIWADLTQVFLPRILGALQTIPLPRVEFTSADLDLVIDNVNFTSASFIPDATHFRNHNEVSCKKGYAAYATEFTTSTTLSISGLRLSAKDISYYINKKSGWLTLEDNGLLDVEIGTEGGDDGLDVTLTVENATEEDRESFFRLTKVEVAVSGFSIYIHDSQHPIRNFFARPALRSYIEGQFVSVLEEQIGALFKQADLAFYDLNQKAAGARLAAPDPFTFVRALFTPTASGSAFGELTSTGITKVGPQGEFILAIGVDEELLPGRVTGLGKSGNDIVGKRRAAEDLMEEGRSQWEGVVDNGEQTGEVVGEEAERLKKEVKQQEREERRTSGWRSSAFDL